MSPETGSAEKDAAAYLKTWAARVEAELDRRRAGGGGRASRNVPDHALQSFRGRKAPAACAVRRGLRSGRG